MIQYLESVHTSSFRGVIKDESGAPVAGAKIVIEGNEKKVETTPRGEYWRMATPGTYRVRAVGHKTKFVSDWKTVVVPKSGAKLRPSQCCSGDAGSPSMSRTLGITSRWLTWRCGGGVSSHDGHLIMIGTAVCSRFRVEQWNQLPCSWNSSP